jgi:hypothetical protein
MPYLNLATYPGLSEIKRRKGIKLSVDISRRRWSERYSLPEEVGPNLLGLEVVAEGEMAGRLLSDLALCLRLTSTLQHRCVASARG